MQGLGARSPHQLGPFVDSHFHPRFTQAPEEFPNQAFIPQLAMEALDMLRFDVAAAPPYGLPNGSPNVLQPGSPLFLRFAMPLRVLPCRLPAEAISAPVPPSGCRSAPLSP